MRTNRNRVDKEETVTRQAMALTTEIGDDADIHLPVTESSVYDFLRKISHNNERLMYIYIFTAIILSTVVITLFRSFLFFAVS